jgi:HD-like signal output (HDOD) protein
VSLKDAIARIGFRGTRDLVCAAAVLRTPTRSLVLVEQIRKQMLVVAACSRTIALQVNRTAADTAFLVGLLQDVGRFLLALAVPERYGEVTSLAAGGPVHLIEQEWLGFTHAEAGAALAQSWGLPSTITQGIGFQYVVVDREDQMSVPDAWCTACGVLAHTLARAVTGEIDASEASADALRRHPVQAIVRVPEAALESLFEECRKAATEMGSIFDL